MGRVGPRLSSRAVLVSACIALTACGGPRSLLPEGEPAIEMRVRGSDLELRSTHPLADCRMQINDAYRLEIGRVPEHRPVVIQAGSLTGPDGVRLDLRATRIDQVALTCNGGRVSSFWMLTPRVSAQEERGRRAAGGAGAPGLEPRSLESDPLVQQLLQEQEALRRRVERLERAIGTPVGVSPP